MTLQIYIVGLGRGDPSALAILEDEKLQAVHTYICPAAPPHVEKFLQQKGCPIINLEALPHGNDKPFPALRNEIIMKLLDELPPGQRVAALILPGRPWYGESMVNLLKQYLDPGRSVFRLLPGEDLLPDLLESLQVQADETGNCTGNGHAFAFSRGVTLFDAACWEELQDPPRGELLITHVYSRELLSKLVDRLLRIYPADQPVGLWQYDQKGEACLSAVWPLRRLASAVPGLHLHAWSYLHLSPPPRCSLGEMTNIMARLRSPEGCPWDRHQDHRSLRPYLLEEAYEVLEAIDDGAKDHLCEELGDLLLQIIFHSELARERGDFSLWDVVDGITRKIYRRHPHVFDNEKLADAGAVSRRWQEIKLQEKGGQGNEDRFALPAGLPALMQAQKTQKRAAAVGFDWPTIEGALKKVSEELGELDAARLTDDSEKVEEEYGDILFALVNVARFLDVDAEQALTAAIRKFKRRFKYIEKKVEASGRNFDTYSLEEMDKYWEEAKKNE